MAKPRVVRLSDRLHHPKYAGWLVSAVAEHDPEYLGWMHNQGFLNLHHSALQLIQKKVAARRLAVAEAYAPFPDIDYASAELRIVTAGKPTAIINGKPHYGPLDPKMAEWFKAYSVPSEPGYVTTVTGRTRIEPGAYLPGFETTTTNVVTTTTRL